MPALVQPSQPHSRSMAGITMLHITEMNRIRLILFDTSNRMFGLYLAAIDRILMSIMAGSAADDCKRQQHDLCYHIWGVRRFLVG
jgi:hypothetical protein